jgi:hypothetical protein
MIAPPSFDGNAELYALNLFLMTAACVLGAMFAGQAWRELWHDRRHARLANPVQLWRAIRTLFGAAAFLRGLAEAWYLWSWTSHDAAAIGAALATKRWLDPVSLVLVFAAMALVTLAHPGMDEQLTKRPLPLDMWSRWPALRRPLGVIAVAMVMAGAAVVLR